MSTTEKTFQVRDRNANVTITIDPEFEALLAPLTGQEIAELKESIRNEGIREPLSVWSITPMDNNGLTTGEPIRTRILLDGHNRYRVWMELMNEGEELSPLEIHYLPVDDRQAAMLWIEQNQIGRRNLTDDQRSMIWASILVRRSNIAKSERATTARAAQDPETESRLSAKTTDKPVEPPAKRDTRKEVAAESKLPEKKLRAAAKLQKEHPEEAQAVRAGKKTLREAIKQTKPATPPATVPPPAYFAATFYTIIHKASGFCVENGNFFREGDECGDRLAVDTLRRAAVLADEDVAPHQTQLVWAVKEISRQTVNRKYHYKPEDFEVVKVQASYTVTPVSGPQEPTPTDPTPEPDAPQPADARPEPQPPANIAPPVAPVDYSTMSLEDLRATPEFVAWWAGDGDDDPRPPEMKERYQSEMHRIHTCTATTKKGIGCAHSESIQDGFCPTHHPDRIAERAVNKLKADFDTAYEVSLMAIEFPESDDVTRRQPTPEDKRTAFASACTKYDISRDYGLQILDEACCADIAILRGPVPPTEPPPASPEPLTDSPAIVAAESSKPPAKRTTKRDVQEAGRALRKAEREAQKAARTPINGKPALLLAHLGSILDRVTDDGGTPSPSERLNAFLAACVRAETSIAAGRKMLAGTEYANDPAIM